MNRMNSERERERGETMEWLCHILEPCLDDSSFDSQTELSKLARERHAILPPFNHTWDSSDDSCIFRDYLPDFSVFDLICCCARLCNTTHTCSLSSQSNVRVEDRKMRGEKKKIISLVLSYLRPCSTNSPLLRQVCGTGVHRVRWLLSASAYLR